MTDTVTYLSCILNNGKYAIGQGLVQAKKIKPHSFLIGDDYNFTPDENGATVRGNLVYTGSKSLISGRILAKDTFQFSLVVPEIAGDFNVGNIMMFVESDDGTVFPFIWVSSKILYPKQSSNSGVANRFVFDFIEKIINATDVLALTVTPSNYASLPGYVTELDLPIPSQALFQQFYVHEPKYAPVPFIGARRAVDNSYWGMPLYFKVGDPFFGILDSGRAGESKRPSNTRYFWGGKLSMSPDKLKRNYGGGLLTDTPKYVIGGEPLPANPGYSV